MIIAFGVDLPDVVFCVNAVYDVADAFHGGEHGVIHVVVAVLSVASDAVEVGDCVEESAHFVETVVAAVVGGICLADFDLNGVHDTFGLYYADMLEFGYRHFDEFVPGHLPQVVAFGAEIFEADPHGVFVIFHHVGRPVVEYLEAADADVAFLYVDPCVGHSAGVGAQFGLVDYLKPVEQ